MYVVALYLRVEQLGEANHPGQQLAQVHGLDSLRAQQASVRVELQRQASVRGIQREGKVLRCGKNE